MRGLLSALLGVVLMILKAVVLVALLVGVGIGGYWGYKRVMVSDYFAVQRLEITGVRRAPEREIQRLVKTARGRNIFTVDLSMLRRSIQAHPWVKHAQVERELPNILRVTIVEHRAQALLVLGHLYLVSNEGQVFKRAEAEELEGLPVITGIPRLMYLNHPQQARKRIQTALGALDRYYSKVRPTLSEVHVNDREEVTLILRRGGMALRMGQELTDERLSKMDAVWAALGPEAEYARVLFLDNEARADRVVARMGGMNWGE
jgi:cell division protein FtsQ